jgi:hypothetical protein
VILISENDWFDRSRGGSIAFVPGRLSAFDRAEGLMARVFNIEPLAATFGAVVTGLRLAALPDTTWHDLHAAWLEYALSRDS